MSSASNNIQSLIDQITFIYSIEKIAGFQLPELQCDGQNIRIRHGLILEAEENEKQCARLEALIELLKPILASPPGDEELLRCFEQTLQLFRRFTTRHHTVGYDTSILVAEVTGRNDILNTLQYCMTRDVRDFAAVTS